MVRYNCGSFYFPVRKLRVLMEVATPFNDFCLHIFCLLINFRLQFRASLSYGKKRDRYGGNCQANIFHCFKLELKQGKDLSDPTKTKTFRMIKQAIPGANE
jgi:hypothetical protein